MFFKALYRGVLDAFCLTQNILDFPRLYTMTVDIYHPVLTVDIDDISVRQSSRQIPCPNHILMSVLLKKRIFNLCLRGLFRLTDILGKEISCHTQFSFITRLTVLIQDIGFHTLQRFAQRCVVISLVNFKGSEDIGFRHSVRIEQAVSVRSDLTHRFGTDTDSLQRISLLTEQFYQLRLHICMGYPVPVNKISRLDRVKPYILGNQNTACSAAQ